MAESIGDLRCIDVEPENIELLSLITGLTERTVRSRLGRAHGNKLVRNALEKDWPDDGERLAALTVATARRAGLAEELQFASGLSKATVRRRLTDSNGKMLLGNAFPELAAADDDDEEPDDDAEAIDGRRQRDVFGDAATRFSVVDLIGSARVVSLRGASDLVDWAMETLDEDAKRAKRRIQKAHGRTSLKTVLGAWWPPKRLGPVPLQVIGLMTAASVRSSPSLIRLIADVSGIAPEDAFERFEYAQGNRRSDNVVPELLQRAAGRKRAAVAPGPSAPAAYPKKPAIPERASGIIIDRRYLLGRELGGGGMGVAYEATDLELDKLVVIKLEIPDKPALLRTEIGNAWDLTHQNIISYKEIGQDPAHGTYLVLQHGGESLHDRIRDRGRFDAAEAIEIVEQAAAGLDYAHRRGVLHQDVKPGNILIQLSNGEREVRVADFGISLRGAASLNTQGNFTVIAPTAIGYTQAYAAPEQLLGSTPKRASDQYSLALVLCSMLEGANFTSRPVLHDFDCLSHWQNQALRRALHYEPTARFDSCAVFAAALRPVHAI